MKTAMAFTIFFSVFTFFALGDLEHYKEIAAQEKAITTPYLLAANR